MDMESLSLFFFFQAEDGIRDLTVTGVQTCALPISGRYTSSSAPAKSFVKRYNRTSELPRERKRRALSYDLSGEGKPGRAGELHHQVLPDQRGFAGNHHCFEVARARLEKPASARGFLDEHFAALAKQAEVTAPVPPSDRCNETCESIACDLV